MVWLTSAAACSANRPAPVPVLDPPAPLARFMRERVNVPFSFAMLEAQGANRPIRVRKAASVLEDAARHLATWADPPVTTPSAREVFFEYARSLERTAMRYGEAIAADDHAMAASTLDGIRRTCNGCHRFFRPASTSSDVGYDLRTLQGGAGPW